MSKDKVFYNTYYELERTELVQRKLKLELTDILDKDQRAWQIHMTIGGVLNAEEAGIL